MVSPRPTSYVANPKWLSQPEPTWWHGPRVVSISTSSFLLSELVLGFLAWLLGGPCEFPPACLAYMPRLPERSEKRVPASDSFVVCASFFVHR